MMPIGLGKYFAGRGGDEILGILKRLTEKQIPVRAARERTGGICTVPGFRRRIGFISAVSHQFCGGCNRVRLTSEGYLKPCLQYESGTDLKTLLRGGAGDPEIRAAMEKAFYEKPAHHQFGVNGQFGKTVRGKAAQKRRWRRKKCPGSEVRTSMGKVMAVCTSPAKGTQKQNAGEGIFIEDYGIQGDAHAGKWHRQDSLLSYEKIQGFREERGGSGGRSVRREPGGEGD